MGDVELISPIETEGLQINSSSGLSSKSQGSRVALDKACEEPWPHLLNMIPGKALLFCIVSFCCFGELLPLVYEELRRQ